MTYEELRTRYDTLLDDCIWECPEGWNLILSDLLKQLNWINLQICDDGIGWIKIFQVKEKWFGLRCYHSLTQDDTVNDIVNACVSNAEYKAKHTCARCGKWLKEEDRFICEDCRGGKE